MLRRPPLWLALFIVPIGLAGWREFGPTSATGHAGASPAGVGQPRPPTTPPLALAEVHISIKTSTAKDDYIQRSGR